MTAREAHPPPESETPVVTPAPTNPSPNAAILPDRAAKCKAAEHRVAADTERPVAADTERPVAADTERPIAADTELPVAADIEHCDAADGNHTVALACEHRAAADSEHRNAADHERKRESTATALLALHRGHVVHRLQGGEFLVTWRGVSLHCRDLAELEAHALRVGAMR